MAQKTKSASQNNDSMSDDYFELVRRFPLRPIRSQEEYDRAGQLLAELFAESNDPGLTSGQNDYLDMLVKMVRDYDERHSSILKARAAGHRPTPLEMLKYLMQEHAMNNAALGKLVGGSGQASLILHGKRQLSKANIRKLAHHFHVSPAIFL